MAQRVVVTGAALRALHAPRAFRARVRAHVPLYSNRERDTRELGGQAEEEKSEVFDAPRFIGPTRVASSYERPSVTYIAIDAPTHRPSFRAVAFAVDRAASAAVLAFAARGAVLAVRPLRARLVASKY